MRSKSYSFCYKDEQKAKQKGIQHTQQNMEYINSIFNSQTTTAINYSIRSDAFNLTVHKPDKLALNPFDDKRVYLNPIQSLLCDKHTQKGDCPCIYCLKLTVLYYKELTANETDEKQYYNIWNLKENLNHQQLLNLISDCAHLS